MFETLKKYKEWVLIIGLLAGLIAEYRYDRKIRKDTIEQLKKLNENWEQQLELNGKFIMYMQLDSQ